MVKVLRLIPELNYGGVETRVVLQAKNNSKFNYEITFCAFHKEGVAFEKLCNLGFVPKI